MAIDAEKFPHSIMLENDMSTTDFLPSREAQLVTWTTNFASLLVANNVLYGVPLGEANAYKTLSDDFIAAYNVAQNNQTRSPANIIAKNQKKALMIESARALSRQIQGTQSVTAQMKSDLGLNPRTNVPTPIPAPSEMPEIDILSVTGRVVKARLHGETIDHRRKPDGCTAAYIWTFVGETPADDLSSWAFWGQSTKTMFQVDFDSSVEPGSKVWLAAAWINAKGQLGPVCDPVSTYTQFGGVTLTMASAKKKAA